MAGLIYGWTRFRNRTRGTAVMDHLLQACCDSRQLLNEVLTCIQDAIIVTDTEGHILFASSMVEDIFEFRPDELEGKNLSVVFSPEDMGCLYPNLLRMAKKNMPFEGELMLLRKGGNRFFAFLVFRPFFDPRQNRPIIAVCVQDIDKEKQLEKAFRESHYDDLVQIANGIAHEIRNPLLGIGGFVNRLFKSDEKTGNRDKYYNYIIKNLKKIEDLIRKVEFFATLPKPGLSEESLESLIQEALGPFIQKINDRKIELSVDIEERILLVDRELILNVFSILISNALDALSEGGKIVIHNDVNIDYSRVHISDTGCGISPQDMPYIFNPFFSTKPDGTGIDLATAKRIMNSHGGHIRVASEKGKGTTFTLLFPTERRHPIRISPMDE
ncbi:MAG: hypothetical protein DRH37_04570 [Deltaproteobacteria bacterium]|nr:MAG: hypothetical protein DRH37_04570 [Deltaproteobacteria bacterium]